MLSMISRRSTSRWEPGDSDGERSHLKLTDGSRIAVIGGGPAGSLFSYYVFGLADTIGLELDLDRILRHGEPPQLLERLLIALEPDAPHQLDLLAQVLGQVA